MSGGKDPKLAKSRADLTDQDREDLEGWFGDVLNLDRQDWFGHNTIWPFEEVSYNFV